MLQVGSELTPAEAAAIRSHMGSHGAGVQLARLDWLMFCHKRRQQLPLDTRFAVPPSALTALARVRPHQSMRCFLSWVFICTICTMS